jgi:hypothetical protein
MGLPGAPGENLGSRSTPTPTAGTTIANPAIALDMAAQTCLASWCRMKDHKADVSLPWRLHLVVVAIRF